MSYQTMALTSPTVFGLKNFEDLQTSTMTVMIYSNVIFNLPKIFRSLGLTEVEAPLTKKQKNVDKKKITAPYGAIVSVQSETKIRGLDLRKKKKRWCTVCQPYRTIDEREYKLNTITEGLEREGDTDVYAIKFDCSNCKKSYFPVEIKKISHFLNQLTIVISIDKQPLLNVMMFKDNFKVAGCKSIDDAVDAILLLWQDHIFHIPDGWELKKGANTPRFVFDSVMKNVGFRLGWPIERPALNNLMNDEKYKERVYMSQYESTGHTNVNIKMYSRRAPDFRYDMLVVPIDVGRNPFFVKIPENPYKSAAKKVKEANGKKYVTFIVFSSSEIILSGKYDKNMKEMYNFFISTVFENKSKIQEFLEAPNRKLIHKITDSIKAQKLA